MLPRRKKFVVFGLAVLLGIEGCKESEDRPTPTPETHVIQPTDTNNEVIPLRKEVAQKRKLQRSKVQGQTVLLPSDTADTKPPHIQWDATTDSIFTKRFLISQNFANSLGSSRPMREASIVHPDSLTWEDIAGIPLVHEETPEWIKALGLAGNVAGILAIIYILFF